MDAHIGWKGLLSLVLSLVACGDDDGGTAGTAGGGAGGVDTSVGGGGSSGATAPGSGGADPGTGGTSGTGGADSCEVAATPLRLLITFPDGSVRDSSTSSPGSASLDLIGTVTAVDGSTLAFEDATSGAVATMLIEGTTMPQVIVEQAVSLSVRTLRAGLGGPDTYQVEIVDATTDQLVFFALDGAPRAGELDDLRVAVERGDNAGCSMQSEGGGSVTGYDAHVVAGAGAVEVALGETVDVPTAGFELRVENQGMAVHVTPPEGYESAAVVGHVRYPDD